MNERDKNIILYICTIIECLGRKSKNRRADVVRFLGKKEILRQLYLAEVNHSLTLEQVTDELIHELGITDGNYDTVTKSRYPVPSISAIAKNYQRWVISEIKHGKLIEDAFYDVFQSFISDEITDFNSSVYYCSPEYLILSYKEGVLLK